MSQPACDSHGLAMAFALFASNRISNCYRSVWITGQ